MQEVASIREDTNLTRVALQFAPEGHIADLVVPPISVTQEDGQYTVFDKSAFNVPNAQRRPRTRYKEIDWTLSKESYHAEEYGLESRIDDRERVAAPDEVAIEATTVENLSLNLRNVREKRVADLVRSTANLTQNVTLAGADQWSHASGGDPIGVSTDAQDAIQAANGYLPNAVVMGWRVYQALRTNVNIRAELLDGEQVTPEKLATLFGVERVLVGRTLYNTANSGQTAVMGDVWGKDVIFAYINPRPADRRPSFAYQLRVSDFRTFRWRDVPVNCDVFRVNEIGGEKIIAVTLAYLVKNAVA
jgi:hypothetical protein